ncbi:MAG: phosphotransferase [Clostridia bacterium]|nr:phosphotransferase [Clostridia bacterium]
MKERIKGLCENFNIKGKFDSFQYFKSGHINTTVLVRFIQDGELKEYVLQKINKNVFKNPEAVMENISNVTNFIKNKLKAKGEKTSRKVLKFYPSQNGKHFTIDDEGDYWRLYKFVNKSVTFNETDNLTVLEETGKAFGEFQQLLDGYPIKDLNIIIPHFHNTVNRYKIFKETLAKDPVNRAKEVQEEIDTYLSLENIATRIYKMQKKGELKLRVTHNDTKCNNVLFDEETGKYLCVIDLDTIMPGLVGFDFGDAVRFAGNTCAEDETDLNKVKLDFDKYEALTKGFVSRAGSSLTKNEQETLALGAITMTLECGVRFLTDYIDGDNYFKTEYPEHNLDRAKCQLTLAQDMIKNYNKMQEIVKQYCKEYSVQQ